MRFILKTLLIAAAAYGLLLFLPFWSAALAAFVIAAAMSRRRRKKLYGKSPAKPWAFWSGFVGVALVWGIHAWVLDSANASLLSGKIAQMLTSKASVPGFGPAMMLLLTTLIGGLIGGMGALTGNLLGEAVRN